jgi:TetR/AcrR family transcriptional regulator, transcriptional repressor for nem operon
MADIKHFDPDVALERVERLFWRHGSASTSIQVIAQTTGLNRSSLYATFGDKRELYLAALRRYQQHRAEPALRALAGGGRGLADIEEFFTGLIELRCAGPFAGWGCMIVNAHLGAEHGDAEVRAVLTAHHEQLRDALAAALDTARRTGQLAAATAIGPTAEVLALLAYGVNLRSRTGANADTLLRTVAAALAPFTG